jgi:Reverse transcriptase (RNA-dependent DNA polymerase).
VSQDFLGSTLSEALDHKDLKDDENKQVIRIIDDIAGCCKDLPTFKRLCKALFTRCKEYNVKLNPAKFQVSTSHINFAGVVISKEGVSPDPERMSGLSKFPRPHTCKQVKSFLAPQVL